MALPNLQGEEGCKAECLGQAFHCGPHEGQHLDACFFVYSLCGCGVVFFICVRIIYRLQVSKTPESMEDLAGLSEAVYREYVGTTGNYLLGRAYIMPPSTPVSSQLLFEFPCSFPVDSPLFG